MQLEPVYMSLHAYAQQLWCLVPAEALEKSSACKSTAMAVEQTESVRLAFEGNRQRSASAPSCARRES